MLGPLHRGVRTLTAIAREMRLARRHLTTWPAYAVDVLAYRGLGLWPSMPGSNAERRAVTRDGLRFTYRRNRGDIQAVRECVLEDLYPLPAGFRPATLIDLGANIGLASLCLCRRYGISRVIAVEPVPENATLAARNLAINGVAAEVIQAAVADHRGVLEFALSASSNLGRVVPGGGLRVPSVTMPDLLDRLGSDADLVKIDIEGGEGVLFAGDLSWLIHVKAIVGEWHPNVVDAERIRRTLLAAGFGREHIGRPGAEGIYRLEGA
ncbi:MAG TPA: FkbM family methyltransferase [Actinomycetota bacterium]|nr:FkbM family methyltransferase [Actinomycetota bacterium]